MVGLLQAGAGVLRLGSLVDYISSPVVLGYITGAGVLIGAGQLHHISATAGERGRLWVTVGSWLSSLGEADPLSVGVAAATVAVIILSRLLNRRLPRRIPSAIVAMTLAIAVTLVLGLERYGLRVVRDIAPVPGGLPPLTVGRLWSVPPEQVIALLPVAVACTVLSLVESSAVARSLAARSGQRLDPSAEFFGAGLANIAAGLFAGYPVSGSPSRSALNQRAGAATRMAGVFTGVAMLVVLLALGPLLDHLPTASLAGLLVVVAYDLVDVPRIRRALRASRADGIAFVVTVLATWAFDLDTAIYVGVGISLVLFLRRARLLTIHELGVDEAGQLRELYTQDDQEGFRRCRRVRMLHVEGALFFGSAGELQSAIDEMTRDREMQVLILRVKRGRGMDTTFADVLVSTARLLEAQGRRLLLVGMTPDLMRVLERSGAADAIGRDHLFPTQRVWFAALDEARRRAVELVGATHCASGCPLVEAPPFRRQAPPTPRPVDPDGVACPP